MASFSGFIRKSPSHRLEAFFKARGAQIPEGFDWMSEGRGTALVRSIEGLIGELPDLRQDVVKAELDHLASLAEPNGLTGAEQICRGQGIDLEGAEGIQDILLMLAVDHGRALDRVAAQTSLLSKTGGKSWSTFQFDNNGDQWSIEDQAARARFLEDAVDILGLPVHRKREADWYQVMRAHPITGEETKITHATIYVEERAESELALGESLTLERHVIPKVAEVGVACNPETRLVEICARGGKATRDQYAAAFAKHFAPRSDPPVEVPRREVLLDGLRSSPSFDIDPADGIETVEVSSLDFYSEGGGFARMERRGDEETLHDFLHRRFGEVSPTCAHGWRVVNATLRIYLRATEQQRRRTLTVTLRTPNTTTLPNKTEADREFVFGLPERWKLLAPPPAEEEGFEVIE